MTQHINGRTQRRGAAAREQRRAEGELRNAAWRTLTPVEQIASLHTRPGKSKRQLTKLGAA